MIDIPIKAGQKYRHNATGRTLDVLGTSGIYATLGDWHRYTSAAIREYWTLIRDAPAFPYWAWDMVGQQPVKVIGQTYACLRLSDGMQVYCSEITRNLPAEAAEQLDDPPQWLVEAEQRMADAADQHDIQADAFGPAVQ